LLLLLLELLFQFLDFLLILGIEDVHVDSLLIVLSLSDLDVLPEANH